MRRVVAALTLAFLASSAVAAVPAPGSDIRPMPRPETFGVSQEAVLSVGIGGDVYDEPIMRPKARGGVFITNEVPVESLTGASREVTRIHFGGGLRPLARPPHPLADSAYLVASAVAIHAGPDAPQPKVRPAAAFFERFRKMNPGAGKSYSSKGSICGVNAIKGVPMKSFGKPGRGCGVANPVRVVEVAGVRLTSHATIDCPTAKALNSWVENGIKPAFGKKGGGVAQIKIVAHYACRNRNNRSGGRLSEHAKGHAVDVGAIVLRDGTQVTVLNGWRSKTWGKAMQQVHRSACGPFGTVLGPRADRYHQDHFHVDTARYRSGTYCR